MWPLPSLNKQFVAITMQPHYLTCSWIEQAQKKAPLVLRAYKRFNLQNLALEKLILFNPTYIKQCILLFLQTHQLKNAFIAFSLSGPTTIEQFVSLQTASPLPDQFSIQKIKNNLWGYEYIYPRDHQFVFYVYQIPHTTLLQFKLFSIAAHLNVIAIIPQRSTLLLLYKFIYGNAFRRAQLAIDMIRYHNMIEYLFSPDLLARIIDTSSCIQNIAIELPYLLPACGLFISEGMR
ncbi:MAG: hypothetical protein WCD44_00815 [Candidatus Babeliales bacterium]|jgi:hypothetical protein